MENQNFYSPPEADLTATPPTTEGVTARMIELLSKTRPWVLFFAILGLIGAAFMLLAGLGLAIMTAVGGAGDMGMAGMGVGMGLLYVLVAALYFFPCWMLLKFAGAISRLASGGGVPAMEEALERQYSFWRLIGILSLTVVGIYVVILIVVVIGAVVAS